MKNKMAGKHEKALPSARKIRRTCRNELYRTVKRLNIRIPKQQLEQAEALYERKVLLNLPWIAEHGDNRKILADWWETEIAPDISEIWNVPAGHLARAFREAFGG